MECPYNLIKLNLLIDFNGTKYSAYILKNNILDPVSFTFNSISGSNYDNITSGRWENVDFNGKTYAKISLYSDDC